MHLAYEWILKNNGICSSLMYKYRANDTFYCSYDAINSVGCMKSYVIAPHGDEILLRDIVANIGPVAVAVDSSPLSFHSYGSDVFYDIECTSNIVHAMLLVGYGTDTNFGDYWLFKNR